MSVVIDGAEFEKVVMDHYRAQSVQWATEVARRVTGPAQAIFAEEMKASPHYAALQPGGALAKTFGFERAPKSGGRDREVPPAAYWATQVEKVVGAASGAVRVEVVPPKGDVLAGVVVVLVAEDYHRGLPHTDNDWVRWLLLGDERVVVASTFGGDFRKGVRVPSEMAGSNPDGNWLVRAAAQAEPKVQVLLERTFAEVWR